MHVLARMLLSFSMISCARWEGEVDPIEPPMPPRCDADLAPLATVDFTGSLMGATATTTGFVVVLLNGPLTPIQFGSVAVAASQTPQWALIRVDGQLNVVDWHLEDKATTVTSAGDAVFTDTKVADSHTVSRWRTDWTAEWSHATGPIVSGQGRDVAASANTVAHAYRVPGDTYEIHVELIDAVSGALLWDVPFAPALGDLVVDVDGNAIAATRAAVYRISRGDGALMFQRTFPKDGPLVAIAPSGFYVAFRDALVAYDTSWTERFTLNIGSYEAPRVGANGDALVLATDGKLTRVDSTGTATSTTHVCANKLLATDSSGRALLADFDTLLLQPP